MDKDDLKASMANLCLKAVTIGKGVEAKKPLPIKISDPTNLDRVVRFRASDETLDRYGDVVLSSGWELGEFVSNPVITAFHDISARWPIGKGVAAGVMDLALYLDIEFDPPEIDAEADKVLAKIRHGTINAGSVGFIALGMEVAGKSRRQDLFEQFPDAKRIFTKCGLYEFTICPVPANPNALVEKCLAFHAASYRAAMADEQERNEKELGAVTCRAATLAAQMTAERIERGTRVSK